MILDFSMVPSDVALAVAQSPQTRYEAASLSRVLGLDDVESGLLYDEMVGTLASLVDRWTA